MNFFAPSEAILCFELWYEILSLSVFPTLLVYTFHYVHFRRLWLGLRFHLPYALLFTRCPSVCFLFISLAIALTRIIFSWFRKCMHHLQRAWHVHFLSVLPWQFGNKSCNKRSVWAISYPIHLQDPLLHSMMGDPAVPPPQSTPIKHGTSTLFRFTTNHKYRLKQMTDMGNEMKG